ncbi:MAG TPA: ABC transporter ATP-binding protein [Anaerolineaceae bacterium]|jgi:branched-chain amino acid transport system ATP-binding protein|nr:ABC transporter ATP-binding protein [Anaerolineaceae bacterium]HOH20971.1 ABC transporter ATP-binding protein [Anaerolineaceae bacterium]HOU44703.1 ABC transporter ATP-binding protein [Anaerolineaceae bacterium]HQF46504.1 ABC transporter ATP-binding protein [Anaerolineaceae bacterium]HQH36380.1 ABC transporter ATP-binding protein [Anaerolineaceae bacterium]
MDPDHKTILEARNLRKVFGGLVAVDDVNIDIQEYSLHSIIGPNGAGKTTLFNMISGVLRPTRGQIIFKGRDITHLPTHQIAHAGIGRSFQITNIFPTLSVLENIRLASQAMGKDSLRLFHLADGLNKYIQKAEEVIALVGLTGKELIPAMSLSHGEKRKLEIGIMLAGDPELLLLDEPTAGMSSEQVPALLEIIQKIRNLGTKTIVLVEHRMDMVMTISDYITVMHLGNVLAEGTPQEISNTQSVQDAYLGALYGHITEKKEA